MSKRGTPKQNIDSYERFFREAREAYYRGEITDWTLNKITRSMMTRDHRMADLIRKEFSPEDYFHIKERMIGTGTIGERHVVCFWQEKWLQTTCLSM